MATDRLYSANNIWVLSLSANIVVMGITATMVEILAEPYSLSLSPAGTNLYIDDDFGSIEGYKLSADLISPIDGIIIEANRDLTIPAGPGGQIAAINSDPYDDGWLVVVQLSNPSELNSLLSAQQYIALIATL